jgi:tripartite-type tricarboxylate transporter receptor subunit TctC
MNRLGLLSALIAILVLAFAAPTLAQDYPTKPVRIITHGGPGSGGPDLVWSKN